jgi:putative transposase
MFMPKVLRQVNLTPDINGCILSENLLLFAGFCTPIINIFMQVQMKAYKYRIYPTDEQAGVLAQIFGSKRWIYNHFLHAQKELWLTEKKHLSHFDMNYMIVDLKKQEQTEWLRQCDSIALQNATEDLAGAYRAFFNSITGKRKGKKMELPRFKKRSNQQSYRTRGVKILPTSIKLPKIKTPVECSFHRAIPDDAIIKSSTVSKTPSGKYFISILAETPVELKPMSSSEVGIDLGITDLMITSDGHKIANPKHQIAKATRLIKTRQQQLAKKQKGSKNYERKRVQLAKLHETITNIKRNYYHNLSNWLVSNYDAIYMEDLNVSGMLKNRKLSRAIQEASWSQLVTMIEYKCGWYGKTFYRISRWTPSSKTCSHCEHKLEKLPLSIRNWTCPTCNTDHDRDLNAAQNILRVGQMDLYGQQLTSQATGEGVEIPMALMKHIVKIEKSGDVLPVDVGMEQA